MAVQPIVEVIIRVPGSVLNDVVFQCPDLAWHEIFLTIDQLRQDGTLTLIPKGQGCHVVQLSDQTSLPAPSDRSVLALT